MQAAILRRELIRHSLTEILVHMGQHYDDQLSKDFLDDLGLRALEINLGIGSASPGVQTSRLRVVLPMR
jgi:UDP-N-acetylglucosamine 2-epimerase